MDVEADPVGVQKRTVSHFSPIRVGGGLQQPKAREIGRHLKMGRGIEFSFGEFLS